MKNRRAWFWEDTILGTGFDRADEFASYVEALGRPYELLEPDQALGQVYAFTVPVPVFSTPEWNPDHLVECDLDARPGRGRVKVFSAHVVDKDSIRMQQLLNRG